MTCWRPCAAVLVVLVVHLVLSSKSPGTGNVQTISTSSDGLIEPRGVLLDQLTHPILHKVVDLFGTKQHCLDH